MGCDNFLWSFFMQVSPKSRAREVREPRVPGGHYSAPPLSKPKSESARLVPGSLSIKDGYQRDSGGGGRGGGKNKEKEERGDASSSRRNKIRKSRSHDFCQKRIIAGNAAAAAARTLSPNSGATS